MAPAKTRIYPSNKAGETGSFLKVIANPEFILVAILCAIGLLLTFNVMLRLPDLAAFLS
jgi:hypothetical protein